MRICVFGPDMPGFEQRRLRERVPPPSDPGVEEILLSNSYGMGPADGTHVYVTAGARTLRMRALRRLLRNPIRARPLQLATSVLWRMAADDLFEGIRAADADVIVSLEPAWTSIIRECVRRSHAASPVITAGDRWPGELPRWRRYDPQATVSIVLPTYNGTRYLAGSLESCLAQTHPRLEVVVVDDGSAPAVADIVGGFADPRLKYVRHSVNRGLPTALNTGFAHASGSLLTWTSDDNRYAPDAIEQMVRFLCTYADVDFVYADAWEIDAAGAVVGTLKVPPPEWLKIKNRIGGCFLYRRAVYEVIGEYDPRAVLAEDYDYWLRVARRFTIQRLFRSLYYYRYHPESLTGRSQRQRVREQAEQVKRTNNAWWRSRRIGGSI